MDYSTENWDKLVSLFSSLYDLIAGFLSQFTLFELIVLGGLVYIILLIASQHSITQKKFEKQINWNFNYIEQIRFDVDAIKRDLDTVASHDDMTSIAQDVEELLRKVDVRDFSYEINATKSELVGLSDAIEELKDNIKEPFDINEFARKFNEENNS